MATSNSTPIYTTLTDVTATPLARPAGIRRFSRAAFVRLIAIPLSKLNRALILCEASIKNGF